jgi:hypothetical protein
MRNVAISFLFLGFMGCGGGGGGGGSESGGEDPFYGGRWRGSASLVINTCPRGLDIPSVVSFDYTVNQAGRDVVVDNNSNGTTFSGELEDDNSGFIAVGSPIHTGSGPSACIGSPGLAFNGLDGGRSDVQLLALLDCASGASCEFGYAGEASRD